MPASVTVSGEKRGTRDRLVETAYDLFCRHGIETVGVDRISREAGVSKMTLYRHFGSKEELAKATLALREERWTGWLRLEVERRGGSPRERLLGCFDVLDAWFRQPDYEGCFFINSMLESPDRTSVVARASARGLAGVRSLIRGIAEEAGVRDPDGFAREWQILMMGALVAAVDRDQDAARRARKVAELLLDREVPAAA